MVALVDVGLGALALEVIVGKFVGRGSEVGTDEDVGDSGKSELPANDLSLKLFGLLLKTSILTQFLFQLMRDFREMKPTTLNQFSSPVKFSRRQHLRNSKISL